MSENKTRKIEDITPEEWREISEHYANQFGEGLKVIKDVVEKIVIAEDRLALFWFIDGINRLIETAKKHLPDDPEADDLTMQ